MFGKKKEPKVINVDGTPLTLQPKPKKGLFGMGGAKRANGPPTSFQPAFGSPQQSQPAPKQAAQYTPRMPGVSGSPGMKPSRWRLYIESIGAKHKGLEQALKERKINQSVYSFVQRMVMAALMLSAIIGATLIVLLSHFGFPTAEAVIFGLVIGIAMFYMFLNSFLNFPKHKTKSDVKSIERDILFAARDMIIALRSGMPLFNSIVSVSTGYGAASKEFARIVERVQLGMPLEAAIDETLEETKSDSFRRLMLQASVSIKAGADVISALQSIIDQLAQERVIELRRYGQRLNAIAMFYMLFGVIMPSMGIAVVTILTTFIALFTVTPQLLEGALVAISFLQIIFLQMIRSSRPSFSM